MSVSISLVTSLIPLLEDAYAHGVRNWISGPLIRIDREQFSDQSITTDDVVIITGTLESRLSSYEIRLSPYISVSSNNPFRSFDVNGFPHFYYPHSGDVASWYFRVEHSLPNPVVLKPGEEIDYEIRAYPLKAGTYHIHSFFIADDEYPFAGAELVARGQTVTVTGSGTPTIGEVTQLYLPLATGAAAMSLLILRARRISKELGLCRIRKGIRLFFAAKCSLEAIWLTGLLFWLALTAYPVIHPFETRFATAIGTTGIIAGLVVGSYFAAVTKSRFQNVVAIGTAGASSLFYFLLIGGYFFFIATSSVFTFGLEYGGFGYNRNPFEVNGMILFAAMIVNAAVAILALLTRKQRHKVKKLATEVS